MMFSTTYVIFKLTVNAFYVRMVFKHVTLCVCACMRVLRMSNLCLGLKFDVPTELSVTLHVFVYSILCTYTS
jgi:hypothetical protein